MRPVLLNWPGRQPESPAAAPPVDLQPVLCLPSAGTDRGRLRLLQGPAQRVADRLLQEGMAGTFDLIHLDPPFGSDANYGRIRDIEVDGRSATLTLPAYGDDDGGDLAGYLEGLEPVLRRCHRLLSPRGSFYLHLDFRRGPYVRLLLDEIFGADHLLNEIVWAYGLGGSSRRRFQRKHDVLYFYAKDLKQHWFSAPSEAATSSMLAGQPKRATDTWQTPDRDDAAPLLRAWPDPLIEKTLSNRDPERTGYPTQKPLALATRIIQASLPPDGKMLDLMAGSGTVGIAALLLGRDAVLGDQSPVALDVARGRAVAAGAEIRLERVEPQDPLVDIPIAPVLLQRSSERNQARLTTLNLPLWTDRLGDGETDAWLRTCATTRGADLLGAWGVAEDRGHTGLFALAWWDGAAPRTREAVRQELSWSMGSETGAPLWWVGYDVAGRGFRSRIT